MTAKQLVSVLYYLAVSENYNIELLSRNPRNFNRQAQYRNSKFGIGNNLHHQRKKGPDK